MPHIIHCPSGMTGSIRGLKVREERVNADRKLQKAGIIVDQLLRACWEETHGAGPYDFEGGTSIEAEGVEDHVRRRFIEDVSMRDADFLVDEFDCIDCGVDTTIEIECPPNASRVRTCSSLSKPK